MRIYNFASRNFKEIIRDPLSVIFAILLPLVLLFVFQQIDIPSEVYDVENFTPGIVVFGFSFISLFTATLVAKDRQTSFLIRLKVSPMKPIEYILGYILALLPICLIQNVLFYVVSIIYGLKLSIGILYSILVSFIMSIMFISLGIIIGSFTNEKSSAGVSSVIVQLVAFTSGMYFDSNMLGKGFNAICDVLPFKHCNELLKGLLNLSFDKALLNVAVVLGYEVVLIVISTIIFNSKSTSK